jgi:hypothetical protein
VLFQRTSVLKFRLPFLLAAPPAIEGRGYFYPGLDGGLSQQVFEVRKLVIVPEPRGGHADMQVSGAMQNKTLERDSEGGGIAETRKMATPLMVGSQSGIV